MWYLNPGHHWTLMVIAYMYVSMYVYLYYKFSGDQSKTKGYEVFWFTVAPNVCVLWGVGDKVNSYYLYKFQANSMYKSVSLPFHCIRISIALHSRLIYVCASTYGTIVEFIRDFCDAEAKLLGYPPFNWEEWSFVVEKVCIILLICILLDMYYYLYAL